MRLTVFAPAKINKYLTVFPPDERGYHPLRTVFQAVSLFDELEICLGGESRVTFDFDGIPARNTVTTALELYSRETETPPVAVHVRKRIPTESGLGGGSSDAAAVLRALQTMLGKPLSDDVVHRIALQVGADVPFFLIGGCAAAEGYGEILTPAPSDSGRWLVLAQPHERCSTREMFRKLDALGYAQPAPGNREITNDFERVAPRACLELIERLRSLGAFLPGLSGSGSAVFGFFACQSDAESAAQTLKEDSTPWAVAVRTLSQAESLAASP